MPNSVGGKKSKHQDDPKVYERLPGQMYGRVLKLLGGCNAMVFCNDNKERLCHIRGNMRRKVWIEVGGTLFSSVYVTYPTETMLPLWNEVTFVRSMTSA
jgi:initiation factor 1A